jgi:hypothetical protein
MNSHRTFRLLFRIFLNRFFDNDTADAAFQTNISQVLGFLLCIGLLQAIFVVPRFIEMSIRQDPRDIFQLAGVRILFAAWGFAIVGFTTLFEWDMLFPDRRDFLVLTPFPIRLRDLCAARFCALGAFLLLMIGSIDALPTAMAVLLSFSYAGFTDLCFRVLAGYLLAALCAPAFAFMAVAALQGILINITTARVFRRMSPWIQPIGMGLMVLSLLTASIYVALPTWWRFIPPVWFAGLHDFSASFALKALAIAFAVFCLTWLAGFHRHYRRTLEAEDSAARRRANGFFDRFITATQERTIFRFTGQTLARSVKHRLFLATYWSVGISLGLVATFRVHAGRLTLSADGLRSFPFLIGFFVVSGFRANFGFPAELSANWLFRITQGHWSETARSAARKRMFISGLLPAMLLFAPIEVSHWGTSHGLAHILMAIAAGAILIEIFFWTFDKVPFTCSYPGRANLALLALLFVCGLDGYGREMADLEAYIDESLTRRLVIFFATAGLALFAFWRRRPTPSPVYFDADPSIQTLNLS